MGSGSVGLDMCQHCAWTVTVRLALSIRKQRLREVKGLGQGQVLLLVPLESGLRFSETQIAP